MAALRSSNLWWPLGIAVAVLLLGTDLLIGTVYISFQDIWNALLSGNTGSDPVSVIVWQTRLPRILAAVLCGLALPLAGLLMQTFFRNPVAGPDMLGITAGAGFAVAMVTMGLGAASLSLVGNMTMITAAVAGAIAVLVLMLLVAGRLRDHISLLILGLMLGTAISAITGILQYFSNREALKRFIMWTFGSLGGVTWEQLAWMFPFILIGIIVAWSMTRSLNLLLAGETYAVSMGLPLRKTRWLLILVAGLLTGTITAFCGPIAFIGIAVPHVARLIFRTTDHRILIPGSMLAGVCIMLLCDMLSQAPGFEFVLPVNSITAIMGAPMVIWLLFRNNNLRQYF